MSVKALTWAFEQPIAGNEKVVLLCLADHFSDEEAQCWPSINRLMKRAHVSKSTVLRCIASLEKAGFIAIQKRVRDNGSNTSNLYRLNFEKMDQRGSAWISVDQRGSGGVNLTPAPSVTSDTPPSVTRDTTPSVTVDTTRTVIKNRHKEPSTISSDPEFEEFWAAYPKRPNNPRKKAMAAYRKARKNVSQKQLLTAVQLYAAYMAGENPKFVAMASTWLNEERWECDYAKGAEVIQSYNDIKHGGDDDLKTLAAIYPGHVGDWRSAQKALADELAKGVSLNELCVAADKYKLFCKGPPYEDRKITPAILETWLKFKWREMDAYEFAKVGPDRIRTVRQKGKAA